MTKFNLILWIVSLGLQIILLAVLLRRGLIGRIPLFTVLIAFYVLRSTVLYTLSSHFGGPSFALILSALAITDIVLQVAVAWELFSAAASSGAPPVIATGMAPGSFLTRLVKFSLLLITAAAFATVLSTMVHASPRAPVDRGILFTSTLFLLVFLASLAPQTPALVRRIAGGFALYAGASILCQIGRTLAAVKRDVIWFNRWSYAEVVSYLAAVLFFLMVCQQKHNLIRDIGVGSSRGLSSATT
jgi:hypothetical protein